MNAANKKFLIISLFILLNNVYGQRKTSTIKQTSDACASQETCASCMRTENCVWCAELIDSSSSRSDSITRCMNRDMVKNRGEKWCRKNNIVNIESEKNITEELEFSSAKGNQVQVTPQRAKMRLRLGDAMKLTVRYKQAEDYPVDLYFLMDLSASMETHRNNLASLGSKLADTMKNITSNFHLGFGSFVDKVVLPMTSTQEEWSHRSCVLKDRTTPCASPYGYKNQMPLTSNITEFKSRVMSAPISGNIDLPEGGLDALMQAMVCWKEIGWRDNARHLLVYSSDALYHIAGDGRLAGIVEPNDEQCHLNKMGFYTHAEMLDYPSLSQIKRKAQENNINIIFAVTDDVLDEYKQFSNYLTSSSIGKLDVTSTNVVKLVSDEYEKLTKKIVMTHNATEQFEVKTFTHCRDVHKMIRERNECGDVRVNKILEFEYYIKATACPERPEEWKQFIEIKPDGVNERTIVEVELVCDCPCSRPGLPGFVSYSDKCSTHGDLSCGVCSCKDGYFGKICNCEENRKIDKSTNSEYACRRTNETEECSGRGNCECDVCRCNPRTDPEEHYYGKFCECDNFSCHRSSGMVCGGPDRGTCECGTCKCKAGVTGEACNCTTSVEACMTSGDNPKECSGFGQCVCGECQCTSAGRSGRYCEVCPSCDEQNKICNELKDCVECHFYKSGLMFKNDSTCNACLNLTTFEEPVDKIDEAIDDNWKHKCTMLDEKNCHFIFTYSSPQTVDSINLKSVIAEREPICPAPLSSPFWAAGLAIGLTLLIGILSLIAWKVLTTIHDHREFAKFEKERIGASYQGGTNPIFKEPTSTFKNPMFENQQCTK